MCGKITRKHFCTLNMLIKIINKMLPVKYWDSACETNGSVTWNSVLKQEHQQEVKLEEHSH
jgi:hypothetical protein